MQKQPFSHKAGAVITFWQVKYCLLWVRVSCIGPLKLSQQVKMSGFAKTTDRKLFV